MIHNNIVVKYDLDFVNWLKSYGKGKTIDEIQEGIIFYYPRFRNDLCDSENANVKLRYLINKNNIKYRKLTYEEKRKKCEEGRLKHNEIIGKKEQDEIMIRRRNLLKTLCNENTTILELQDILKTKHNIQASISVLRRDIMMLGLKFKKGYGQKRTEYSEEFITFMKQACEDKTQNDIREIIKTFFPEYNNLYEGEYYSQALNRFLKTRNIEYKHIAQRDIPRKNKIYDDKVMTAIKQLARPDKTIRELISELNELFPNKNISNKNIYEPLRKNNIPYASSDVHGRPIRLQGDLEVKPIVSPTYNSKDIEHTDIFMDNKSKELLSEIEEENKVEDRFIPIKAEVKETAKVKFKQLNCDINLNLTTNDYLECMKLLRYICGNINNIELNRLNQHDIMTNFGDDVIHTIENETPANGDTYLQDKLKVVRNLRRYYEYDMEDMSIIKNFINSVDIKKLDIAITKLEEVNKSRQDIVYIPTVDSIMVNKYDWAIKGSLNSEKVNKPILKSTMAKQIYTNQNKTFRATCQISGGPYGVFQTWIRDYRCNTQEDALSNAKKELADIIRKNRGGVHYINLNAHQINR